MTLSELLDRITLAGVATTIALVLSVWTFARQEIGRRAAGLTLKCENVPGQGRTTHTYVVIHNAGPAPARGVQVKLMRTGDTASPVEVGRIFGDPVDIPAGHTARLSYVIGYGDHCDTLEMNWRDKRRGTQTLVAPFNLVEMPGTPVVNVNVEPISMDDVAKGVAHKLGNSGGY